MPYPDLGIDLVAETFEGDFWSIQCKYEEDESKSIGHKKLGTFGTLSFKTCNNISLALVCTSVDRFSHKLDIVYEGDLSFCSGERYRKLDEEFFSQINDNIARKAKMIKPFSPMNHQEEAIRKAKSHFVTEKNKRGKMIMPCGSGKSLTAYWIAEELKSKLIFIAVPSLFLIKQTLEVWARESLANKQSIRWICVCSDETVKNIEKDDINVLTQDLGVEVKQKPSDIAKWLCKKSKDTSVVFVTYQSGKVLSEAAMQSKRWFDLGIYDEAHKTAGTNTLFNHLLFEKNIKVKKRLFMTATERRYKGASEDIIGMEKLEIYGKTFALLTFKEALECKPRILCDYQIVTMLVTTEEVKKLINSNILVEPKHGPWNGGLEARMLAAALQLRKTMEVHPFRHCISFHSSISRAEAFQLTQDKITKKFSDFGDLKTFHITGSMPTSMRERKLDEAISCKRSLITNARCLTEGVDVKKIDGILFADPKGSTVDIVQAIGRALRPSEGKKNSFILIPIVLDSKKLENGIEEKEAFNDILMVLRSLATNDERIIEYFKSVSHGKPLEKGKKSFVLTIPDGLEIDAEEFAKEVELMIWDKLAKLSWRPFEEARGFVRGLNLNGKDEWFKYVAGKSQKNLFSKPSDIPTNPSLTYANKGWVDWGDWTGTNFVATHKRRYRPYEKAKKFVHKLELSGKNEWDEYKRGNLDKPVLPKDIPRSPSTCKQYKDKWKGWGDWLGTNEVAPSDKKFVSYEEAKQIIKPYDLGGESDFRKLCSDKKRPSAIPSNPDKHYKDNNFTWGDFLGTTKVQTQKRKEEELYRSFIQAREYARGLGLKKQSDWFDLSGNLPKDIPYRPDKVYTEKPPHKYSGWVDYPDWLGYGTKVVLSDGREFKNGAQAAEALGVSKERINRCVKNGAEIGSKIILSDGREFESGSDAAKEIGVTTSSVNRAIIRGRKVKGYTVKKINGVTVKRIPIEQ